MLGTLIYYYLNPNKSTIDSLCPEAAYCYAHCLRYTPDRNDIAEYLAQVHIAQDGEESLAAEENRDQAWAERLLKLVEKCAASETKTLEVGQEEARQIGRAIHAAVGSR